MAHTPVIPIFANTGANPTQSTSTQSTLAAKFRGMKLDPKRQKEFVVYFLAQVLKQQGGTDYTGAMATAANLTTMLQTVHTALEGFDYDDLNALMVWIWYQSAVSQGANVPLVEAGFDTTLSANTAGLRGLNLDDLNRVCVYLLDQVIAKTT